MAGSSHKRPSDIAGWDDLVAQIKSKAAARGIDLAEVRITPDYNDDDAHIDEFLAAKWDDSMSYLKQYARRKRFDLSHIRFAPVEYTEAVDRS